MKKPKVETIKEVKEEKKVQYEKMDITEKHYFELLEFILRITTNTNINTEKLREAIIRMLEKHTLEVEEYNNKINLYRKKLRTIKNV